MVTRLPDKGAGRRQRPRPGRVSAHQTWGTFLSLKVWSFLSDSSHTFQARAGTLGRAPLGHIRTFITNLNPEPRVFLRPLDRGQDQTSNRKKVVCHFNLHHLFINFNTLKKNLCISHVSLQTVCAPHLFNVLF